MILKALKDRGFSLVLGNYPDRRTFRAYQKDTEVFVPDYLATEFRATIDAAESAGVFSIEVDTDASENLTVTGRLGLGDFEVANIVGDVAALSGNSVRYSLYPEGGLDDDLNSFTTPWAKDGDIIYVRRETPGSSVTLDGGGNITFLVSIELEFLQWVAFIYQGGSWNLVTE